MTFKVQRGTALIGVGFAPVFGTFTYPEPINTARGFARLCCVRKGSSGRDIRTTDTLGNDDFGGSFSFASSVSVRITREFTAGQFNHRYYLEIIESPDSAIDGFRVLNEGQAVLSGGQDVLVGSAPAGLTDPSRSVLWVQAVSSDRTTERWGAAAVVAWVDSDGRPNFARQGAAGQVVLSYVQLEMGTAWTVRRITSTLSTPGVDVPVPGAGSEPWSQKMLLSTYSVPSGSHQQASNLIVRPNLTEPDEVLAAVPALAEAGIYYGETYVLHHPTLAVGHAYDPGFGGLGVFRTTVRTPHGLALPLGRSSMEVQATNLDAGLGYYRQGWAWQLQAGEGLYRRCRADGTALTALYSQFIRWPSSTPGRMEASTLEPPCWAQ